MSKRERLSMAILYSLIVVIGSLDFAQAAESKPPWQMDWEKTVKVAEEEGALVIYMTQAF
jgi:hypothetical protein